MTITADSISYDGEVRHLKGSVEIVVGGFRIRANEADVTSVTPR
jgi:lipopolysaccharide export system protein LptA